MPWAFRMVSVQIVYNNETLQWQNFGIKALR